MPQTFTSDSCNIASFLRILLLACHSTIFTHRVSRVLFSPVILLTLSMCTLPGPHSAAAHGVCTHAKFNPVAKQSSGGDVVLNSLKRVHKKQQSLERLRLSFDGSVLLWTLSGGRMTQPESLAAEPPSDHLARLLLRIFLFSPPLFGPEGCTSKSRCMHSGVAGVRRYCFVLLSDSTEKYHPELNKEPTTKKGS